MDMAKGDIGTAEEVVRRLEEANEEDAIEEVYLEVVKMSGRIYSTLSQKAVLLLK